MLGLAGFRNRKDVRETREEVEDDLPDGASVALRDFRQHPAGGGIQARERFVSEGRVGHHRDLPLLAVGDQLALDAAVAQMVEDLVGSQLMVAQRGLGGFHLRDVEVADSGETDLAFVDRGAPWRAWYRPADSCPPNAGDRGRGGPCRGCQAPLARAQRAVVAGVGGEDFAHQEHFIAAPGDGFTGEFLGAAVAVHFGGVDVRKAEIQAHAQGLDGAPLAVAGAFDHPGALPDDRDIHAGPAECALRHDAIIAQRRLTILGTPVPGSRLGYRLRSPRALCQEVLIERLPDQRLDDRLPAHVEVLERPYPVPPACWR